MSEDDPNKIIIELNINLKTTNDQTQSPIEENQYLKTTIKTTLEQIKTERIKQQEKIRDLTKENEELRLEINKLRQDQRVKK